MANEFLTNKIIFNDPSGRANMYASGRALYFMDELIWPTGLYGINTNELIIISIDLASGCTEQQIIFPNNYQSIPKIAYSIYGLNQEDIVGSHLSEITSGYAIIRFTHPIPNDQYNIQLFMFRNDTYKTISGTTYDFNAIQWLDSRWLDSYYGWDSQGVPDRMAFPYRTITGTESWAGESGVNMYLGKGDYDGGNIGYGNTHIVFAPQARITSPIGIGANKTINFYNAVVDITGSSTSGILLASGATANFYGESRISMAGDATTKYAIQGSQGSVNVYGNLYANRPISVGSFAANSATGPISNGYEVIVESGAGISHIGNSISGVNRRLIFSDIGSGVANAMVSDGTEISIRSGKYNGFSVNKNVSLKFDKGATVLGPISFTESASIENLSLSSASSGIGIAAGKILSVFGDCSILASSNAITGNGTVKKIGRISYNAPISQSVIFDQKPDYAGIISPEFSSATSGFDGTYMMSDPETLINLVSTGSRILIRRGTYSGFRIGGKNASIIDCDENSKIISTITLSGAGQKVTFNGLRFDAGTDIGVTHAVSVSGGSTGEFLGDSYIRVPYYYSPYYITGTAPNTGEYRSTSVATINYTGTFFNEYVSGVGISGHYYRAGGTHTGYFVNSVTGEPITGYYSSASGSFNGSVDLNLGTSFNAIFKYVSGGNSYFRFDALTGTNITGSWYSGVCYYWEDSVTGSSYLIGYKISTGEATGLHWDLGIDHTGRSGYYWSGSAGSFTNGVSGCNYTGYYTTGADQTGGYFETSYGPVPFVTGYYYSGGLSGWYISGGPSALTGVISSGLFLNTRYSASGDGAVSMRGALYNQLFSPNITNLLGNHNNFNTGSLFDPWGIAYA